MLKAVHRKSFTQLNAKFRSKDPGINGMFQAGHRKSFTKLSAKFRSKDPGMVGMLQAVHHSQLLQALLTSEASLERNRQLRTSEQARFCEVELFFM